MGALCALHVVVSNRKSLGLCFPTIRSIAFGMSKLKTISNMAEAIDELGGPRKIATYLGIDEGAVTNWRSRGFPAWTYVALNTAFQKSNIVVEPELFNQRWPSVPWEAVRDGLASYQSRRRKRVTRNGRR
jgi:hypothetical protein